MAAVVEHGLHLQRPAAHQRRVALEAVPLDHRAGLAAAGAGARAGAEMGLANLRTGPRPQVVVVDEDPVQAGARVVGPHRQAATVAVVAAVVLLEAGGGRQVAVARHHQAVDPGLEQLEGLRQRQHRGAVVVIGAGPSGHQVEGLAATVQVQPLEVAGRGVPAVVQAVAVEVVRAIGPLAGLQAHRQHRRRHQAGQAQQQPGHAEPGGGRTFAHRSLRAPMSSTLASRTFTSMPRRSSSPSRNQGRGRLSGTTSSSCVPIATRGNSKPPWLSVRTT